MEDLIADLSLFYRLTREGNPVVWAGDVSSESRGLQRERGGGDGEPGGGPGDGAVAPLPPHTHPAHGHHDQESLVLKLTCNPG